jgi:hypothetical protein
MRKAIVILILVLVAGPALQAQTKLEDAGLSSPRSLVSRFLDDHWTAYTSLMAKVQNKDEYVGLSSLLNITAITAERLQVISDLYELYMASNDPKDKKLLLFLITRFCKHFANLTETDVHETTLVGKLTQPSAWERNDKMLTDLVVTKKLFEQLPKALAQ